MGRVCKYYAVECCDICDSIQHRSIPVVCEPDSPGLSTASEALAGAGRIGGRSGMDSKLIRSCWVFDAINGLR